MKNVKNGVYVESMEECISYDDIKSMEIRDFKMVISFMEEKELGRVITYCDKNNLEAKSMIVFNTLSEA